MKLSLAAAVIFVAAFSSAQQPQARNSSTASVTWGTAVNGLRLGTAFGSDRSKSTLRLVFQNVGSDVQEFLIARDTPGGPSYDGLTFIATAPDGKQEEGVHRGLYIPVEGLVLPVSVRLNAGETHELEFPLTDIIYASRTTVTLDALVKQGYSVTVRFKSNQAEANWANLSRPWIGTLISPLSP